MSAMTPVPKDHPLMIAWEAYKATDDYTNTKKWAGYEQHVEGSLWAAFVQGWAAYSAVAPAPEVSEGAPAGAVPSPPAGES